MRAAGMVLGRLTKFWSTRRVSAGVFSVCIILPQGNMTSPDLFWNTITKYVSFSFDLQVCFWTESPGNFFFLSSVKDVYILAKDEEYDYACVKTLTRAKLRLYWDYLILNVELETLSNGNLLWVRTWGNLDIGKNCAIQCGDFFVGVFLHRMQIVLKRLLAPGDNIVNNGAELRLSSMTYSCKALS